MENKIDEYSTSYNTYEEIRFRKKVHVSSTSQLGEKAHGTSKE